jgi:hypothetical protein
VTSRQLARNLLHCGVLREDDWHESVQMSLDRGVTRWVREAGVKTDQSLFLSFHFTDDVRSMESVAEWNINFKESGRPVGLFGFRKDPYGDLRGIAVGHAVLDLEQISKGAGWNVYRALLCALHETCGAFSPWNAGDFIEQRIDYLRDDPKMLNSELSDEEFNHFDMLYRAGNVTELDDYISEQTGLLTPTELVRSLPKPCFAISKPRRAPIRRALQSLGSIHRDDVQGHILELTLRLMDVLERTRRRFRDSPVAVFTIGMRPSIPVVVRWSWDDEMGRASDDEIESMSEDSDYVTDLTWFAGFYVDDAASVARAAERARHALEIVTFM